jgi:hypothetical protein
LSLSPPLQAKSNLNWERVNNWTLTLYTLIHSLRLAKAIEFGNLATLKSSLLQAGEWIPNVASFNSVLLTEPFGNHAITFRRDPNIHFQVIITQIVTMLIQDLVVILDSMMDQILAEREESAGEYPRNKIMKLTTHLNPQYIWAMHGCLELVAVRNVLTHSNARWSQEAILLVSPFLEQPPSVGDQLSIGFPMLFRYRKAIRTFLNEVRRDS